MGILSGKVAVVTGAGRGIGKGIAFALAREDAAVAVLDRDAHTASETAAELHAIGARALPVICDVSRSPAVDDAVVHIDAQLGGLDILINNAQALRAQVPFEDHSDADFDLAIDTGLRGTFHMMRAAFPLLARNGGRIVNVASSAGTHGQAGLAAYAAAKEGIRGLTKVAANEWGRHGILVNVICPAVLSEPARKWGEENPDLMAEFLARRPISRHGDAEADIGRTVVFLSGPDSSFITGQTLMVNGGGTILP
jgi:NAD(P)-dependent dehydrogenase (short-subunit alcohol dehydrogenase family)